MNNEKELRKDFYDFMEMLFGENKERKNMKPTMNNKTVNKTDKETYRGFVMKNMENNIGVTLEYLVPGIDKKELSVCFDNDGVCCVESNKEVPFFGNLKSKVKMNFEIDYKKIKSKLENGILKIDVFKKECEKNKNISINID